MFKKCLTYVLICVFLVKFITETESRNELFLSFGFSFFWVLYQNFIVSSLSYKTTKKINIEIELVVKDCNASTTSSSNYKFSLSEKLRKREI